MNVGPAFAIAGLGGLLGLLLGGLADDDDDEYISSNSGAASSNPVDIAGRLSCEQALQIFATYEGSELAHGVALALSSGRDPNPLNRMAMAMQARAGAQGVPSEYRAALLRLAQCVRDRVTAISTLGIAGGPAPINAPFSQPLSQEAQTQARYGMPPSVAGAPPGAYYAPSTPRGART